MTPVTQSGRQCDACAAGVHCFGGRCPCCCREPERGSDREDDFAADPHYDAAAAWAAGDDSTYDEIDRDDPNVHITQPEVAPEPEGGKLAAIRGVLAEFDWDTAGPRGTWDALLRIDRIAAGSRTESGIEPGGSAYLTPADLATVLSALDEAAGDLRVSCPDCRGDLTDICDTCASRLARASDYDTLAERLGGGA